MCEIDQRNEKFYAVKYMSAVDKKVQSQVLEIEFRT